MRYKEALKSLVVEWKTWRGRGIIGHLILVKEVMMAMKKVEGIKVGGIGMEWMSVWGVK